MLSCSSCAAHDNKYHIDRAQAPCQESNASADSPPTRGQRGRFARRRWLGARRVLCATKNNAHTHTHTHTYLYIYIWYIWEWAVFHNGTRESNNVKQSDRSFCNKAQAFMPRFHRQYARHEKRERARRAWTGRAVGRAFNMV